MKLGVSILLLVFSAAPALAQVPDDGALPDAGMMEAYAQGDLALVDIQKGSDPLHQVKRFFSDAKLPLTSTQERDLKVDIDSTLKSLRAAESTDAVRKANQDFFKAFNAILTPDQQTALKRYRNQEIMMRGGFPALKLALENGQAPLSPEQEKQIQTIYQDLNVQAAQFMRTPSDKDRLDELETNALGKVVRLLTPAQRRALVASRLGTLSATSKPPQ